MLQCVSAVCVRNVSDALRKQVVLGLNRMLWLTNKTNENLPSLHLLLFACTAAFVHSVLSVLLPTTDILAFSGVYFLSK